MDALSEEIKDLIKDIDCAANSPGSIAADDEFWREAGARLLSFVDNIVQKPEIVNMWTPKDYAKDKNSLLAAVFVVLSNMKDVNRPFNHDLWPPPEWGEDKVSDEGSKISFYELALSRCCSFTCQLLGDRFQYVQKLLIRHLFGTSVICSMFASDMYMFLARIVHPNRRAAMSQIITNLCKLAPPQVAVMGASLVNRMNKD